MTDLFDASGLRQRALSTWDEEGGAAPPLSRENLTRCAALTDAPDLTNAELVQLRIRVIALENLVIALLADAPAEKIELVREMAAYISPRPGFTHHPMTILAAAQMLSLAERSVRFGEVSIERDASGANSLI